MRVFMWLCAALLVFWGIYQLRLPCVLFGCKVDLFTRVRCYETGEVIDVGKCSRCEMITTLEAYNAERGNVDDES